MNRTRIEWTDFTWNPVTGCSRLCNYCYAKRISNRFRRPFEPTCHPGRLSEPLRLAKPAKIFVCSMGDLFDPVIPDEFIDDVWAVMAQCEGHTFQVLTKQPRRMAEWFKRAWRTPDGVAILTRKILPNVWLGVTMEHDGLHDRVWRLLQTPAAVRFVSIEPILGPVDLDRWELICRTWRRGFTIGKYLDWVIIGNDSRPGQPIPDPAWVQAIIDQCRAAEVPIFVKGRLAEQWPIQEWPKREVSR